MFLTSECGQSSWNTAWVMNQNQSHSLKMWSGLIRSVKENCERNWETIIAMYYHGPSYMRIEFWLFHVVIFLQWFDVLDIANSNGLVIHSGQATEGFDFFPSYSPRSSINFLNSIESSQISFVASRQQPWSVIWFFAFYKANTRFALSCNAASHLLTLIQFLKFLKGIHKNAQKIRLLDYAIVL